MGRLVRVFHGGIVRENGEFENMREELEIFDSPPTFFLNWADRGNATGRFDSGKSRAHYVLMNISCNSDWTTKEIVKSSNVRYCEVVAELQTMSDFVRVKKEVVEAMLKLGEEDGEVKGRMDSRDAGSYMTFDMCDNFDRAVVSDRLDSTSLNEIEEEEDGDISLGSDGKDEGSEEEGGEEEGEADEEEGVGEDDEEAEEGGEHRCSQGGGEEERRILEAQNVPLPEVHFHEDLTHVDLAICDTGLGTINETTIATEAIIQDVLRFETLEKLQDFLRDNAVRHHHPFKVKHSDTGLRYTVVCNQGCPWSVHAHCDKRLGGWKITSVKQPHTCHSS
ncbi:hypothetical protein BS78_K199200 [Paspalum vaginatum]|uniref:Transposase MuDR plant domain-containing protein n=1 Tax=Paspalum vaginatum TaxID=158149 RepID=A0A9W7X8Y2_9POAL|nr:hypothetical protein BS78_K199200 [Paspalum vaginatum]